MKSETDEFLDTVATGQRSALVKSEVSRRLAQQEERVLSATLTLFRSGLLSAEQARDAIAQISALREFAHSLDKEITKGTEARASLVSPGPRNGGQR